MHIVNFQFNSAGFALSLGCHTAGLSVLVLAPSILVVNEVGVVGEQPPWGDAPEQELLQLIGLKRFASDDVQGKCFKGQFSAQFFNLKKDLELTNFGGFLSK